MGYTILQARYAQRATDFLVTTRATIRAFCVTRLAYLAEYPAAVEVVMDETADLVTRQSARLATLAALQSEVIAAALAVGDVDLRDDFVGRYTDLSDAVAFLSAATSGNIATRLAIVRDNLPAEATF